MVPHPEPSARRRCRRQRPRRTRRSAGRRRARAPPAGRRRCRRRGPGPASRRSGATAPPPGGPRPTRHRSGAGGRCRGGEQRRPRAVRVGHEAPRRRVGRRQRARRVRQGAAPAGRRTAPRPRGRGRCAAPCSSAALSPRSGSSGTVRAPSARTTSAAAGSSVTTTTSATAGQASGGGDGVREQGEHQLVVGGAGRAPSVSGRSRVFATASRFAGTTTDHCGTAPCEHTRSDDGRRWVSHRAVGLTPRPSGRRGPEQRRGVPVAQDASPPPTAGSGSAARSRKRRARRRGSLALWIAVAVIYPAASLLFRLRYRHAERIPAAARSCS